MGEEWKTVVVEWNGDFNFTGKNTSGGSVQIGTKNSQSQCGVSPMDLLLLGLAGCTGIDVVSILKKKKHTLSDFQIRVKGKRAEEPPRVYTDITVEYHFWGEGIDVRSVEHAIQLSEDKYCSASAMLGAVAKINTEYSIHPI
jgi:putative redox protein